MNKKVIIILATLDTKAQEAEFLKEQIAKLGGKSLIIDVGVIDKPLTNSDISREEVAEAGGIKLSKLLESPDREVAAPVMAKGTKNIVNKLVTNKKADGIIAIGGTQGTTLATSVMRTLPYGFPKVMVSTMASGNVAPWVDIKDITMMFSVTDILGLNPVMRKILANAAGAVLGMANVDIVLEKSGTPLIAITNVGITTKGAMLASDLLKEEGYETIIFHAIGPGGRAMEQMMKEGIIGAVLDLSTIEVSNEMYNALLAGGKERLMTAGKLGIPQVVCPGAIEVLVFNEPETVPDKYSGRKLISHSPQITDVRLNKEEMAEVGREMARRLSFTKNRAVFMIPKGGYDSYAVKGQDFYDPEADNAFVEELRSNLSSNFEILEMDEHIEDPSFIKEAVKRLIYIIENH